MIDLTWGGWIKGKRAAIEMGLPYIRVQGAENHHLFRLQMISLSLRLVTQKQLRVFQIEFNFHYAKSYNINLFPFMN